MNKRAGRIDNKSNSRIKSKNYLYAIAIDNYMHFPKLSNAVKDVNDIVQILVGKFQFEIENVICLYNEDATENGIYQLFKDSIKKVSSEDNLLIYFAGHGYYDEVLNDSYWIPIEAKENNNGDFISHLIITNYLKSLKARHTLLFSDSCFSEKLITKRQKRNVGKYEQYRSCRVFVSGIGMVDDGILGKNSPFASAIIDFLNNENNFSFNVSNLIEYVKQIVETKTGQTPVDARINDSQDEFGEFIFSRNLTDEEVWNNLINKSNIQKLKEFVKLFPTSNYAEKAISIIYSLQEEDDWKQIRRFPDSLNLLTNFIQKHPKGKYIDQAQQELREIFEREKLKNHFQVELIKRQAEIDARRQDFEHTILNAEAAFQIKNYKRARELYWEGSKKYLEKQDFVPDKKYINNQIALCNKEILFSEYFRNGKRAMLSKNYRLALDYFQKAQQFKDNQEVCDFINKVKEVSEITKITLKDSLLPVKHKIKIVTPMQKDQKVKIPEAPHRFSNPIATQRNASANLVKKEKTISSITLRIILIIFVVLLSLFFLMVLS